MSSANASDPSPTNPDTTPASAAPIAASTSAPADQKQAVPSKIWTQEVLRWICTHNPFYIISAGLFLGGLYVSFGDLAGAEQAWALMSGLAGYTLLLAAVACLLVRFGNVWDDMRTILLVVVLMFLVTALTFDRVLVEDPALGVAFNLGGYIIAIFVSEAVLRGIRLRLPLGYRLPYYIILGVFFLYPLALSPLLTDPLHEGLLWGLFGFSSVAGAAFLLLLPAIRRGPEYVRDNGSPWRWPAYPWALFTLLGLAVPVRAYLVCWSLHMPDYNQLERLIFGPYFLVSFGLCIAVLLLEIGLVTRDRRVVRLAFLTPAALLVLTFYGHRADPYYDLFLRTFADRLGGYPLFVSVLLAIAFYAYAALRRVPLAAGALTAALVLLAFVPRDALRLRDLGGLQAWPILAATGLQLALGLWRRAALPVLVSGAGMVTATVLLLPREVDAWSLRGPIAIHLTIVILLLVGAAFQDAVGKLARMVGISLALAASVAVVFVPFRHPLRDLSGVQELYPLIMAALLALYGMLTRHRLSVAGAATIPVFWATGWLWRAYQWVRHLVTGLDYLVLSMLVLVVAIVISLVKAGAWSRRLPEHETRRA